jgi:hypothetical protein
MTPYTSIASIINTAKPNLKEFWSVIDPNTANTKYKELINEPYSHLNLFKIELLLVYMDTHSKAGVFSEGTKVFKEYLDKHYIITNNLFHINVTYARLQGFTLSPYAELPKHLIIGNVIEAKQYLNPYLRSKLNTTETTSTAYGKSIEPNYMSLTIFQQWITTVKPFNSVQAEEFIKQCTNFPKDFKNDFINSILGHCTKPSISLQKYLTNRCKDLKNYPSVNRNTIRSNSNQHLTFRAVLDSADSAYKPFVTNINRLAPDTEYEVEATIGYAFATLQQSNYSQVLYDELIKHAQQAPSDILDIYKANLLIAQQALNKLIKDL